MSEKDVKTETTKTQRYWGVTPTCYWLDAPYDMDGPVSVMKRPIDQDYGSLFNVSLMKRPIDQDYRAKFKAMTSKKFETVIVIDSIDAKYPDDAHAGWFSLGAQRMQQAGEVYTEAARLIDVKDFLQFAYQRLEEEVLMIHYNPDSIKLRSGTDLFEFLKNFPLAPRYTMYWLREVSKLHREVSYAMSELLEDMSKL